MISPVATARDADADWHRLGDVLPTALAPARVQLHHAAQVANAAAISLLPSDADDGHTSFAWDAGIGALVGRPLPAERPLRFALVVGELTLAALEDGRVAERCALDGRSQAEALAWVRATCDAHGLDGARVDMRRHYTIPGTAPDAAHPWRRGTDSAFAELSAWYANAASVLGELARRTHGASPVTCWPHHFDIATLLELPTRGGVRRTIGVGLSPGDEWYAEPYLYVGPSPRPAAVALPALPRGHWHVDGWFGAVLPGGLLVDAGDAGAQRRAAVGFVEHAVAVARALLGDATSADGDARS